MDGLGAGGYPPLTLEQRGPLVVCGVDRGKECTVLALDELKATLGGLDERLAKLRRHL